MDILQVPILGRKPEICDVTRVDEYILESWEYRVFQIRERTTPEQQVWYKCTPDYDTTY